MSDDIKPELRMYCVVRGDLDFGNIPIEKVTGKLMGQAGHAFVTAIWQVRDAVLPSGKSIVQQYFLDNQTKIVVKCKNLDALTRAEAECKALGLNCFVVTDAAHTIFQEPTVTCMAIGPCYRDELPKYIQKMQLL